MPLSLQPKSPSAVAKVKEGRSVKEGRDSGSGDEKEAVDMAKGLVVQSSVVVVFIEEEGEVDVLSPAH